MLAYPHIADRLRLADAELNLILTALLSQAEVVAGQIQLPGVTRGPQDDPLVAAAIEGKADYLVSGDRDVLDMGSYESVQIVTPREFVEILDL